MEMSTIPAPAQRNDMGVFEQKKDVGQQIGNAPGPESLLKIPGLLIVDQAKVYDVADFGPYFNAFVLSKAKNVSRKS